SFYRIGNYYRPSQVPITARYPVDYVTWHDCQRLLGRQGLQLPTEAQWEYCAGAERGTPWFCGGDPAGLDGFANVLDETAVRAYPSWKSGPTYFDDGWAGPAPVGSFGANPFGLHDVYGNVAEWCRDVYGSYDKPIAGADGLRHLPLQPQGRGVARGGTHRLAPRFARTAMRTDRERGVPSSDLGARASRPLH
ncbi:MAG: SUMF1/EgtB/PvdO family nonheme iron enzyme, partial [Planctomycetes bacterium]|nr:SUMF1/EgtB/PvdO family nonheme iron enzyme [Planctomycetota bacterium]